MDANIFVTPIFQRQYQTLVARHAGLLSSVWDLQNCLPAEPPQGVNLGHECYRVAMPLYMSGQPHLSEREAYFYLQLAAGSIFLLAVFLPEQVSDLPALDALLGGLAD
jgi:hypothetical protein